MVKRLTAIPDNHFVMSLFRVILAFHLLKKIIFWWPSLGLILSKNSFVVINESTRFMSIGWIDFFSENYRVLVMVHVLLILFFLFGIGKNITAILLFLSVEVIQRISGGLILNGGDSFLKFALLYMIFINSYEYFILKKKGFKRDFRKNHWLKNVLTNVFSKSILIHFAIIYFFAGFYKIHADVWFNGVANYYVFQLERFKAGALNDWIVARPALVTLTTYFTIFWEILFPIVLFSKKARNWFLFLGLGFHVGIYFLMMINDFALLFMMSYITFFNDKEVFRFIVRARSIYRKIVKKHGKSRLSSTASWTIRQGS